jgi:RNA polymerase sigma factor (sigma-70 family)
VCGHTMYGGGLAASAEFARSAPLWTMANHTSVGAITVPHMHEWDSASDAALVSALGRGDSEAFRLLYDRYVDVVYNHCFRLTGSTVAAEDLAAVTFLECWRRRSAFRLVDGSAAPWLHGIARNVARNAWRAERRYRAALGRLAETRVEPDPADDVVERIAAEQAIRRLLPAMQTLPSREREVVELCAAAGLSHGEVAILLGIPAGTVKSRLARGLARLRAALALQQASEGET